MERNPQALEDAGRVRPLRSLSAQGFIVLLGQQHGPRGG